MSKLPVITIGRQFGSGGREIGRALGAQLGLRVYDRELLTRAAEREGLHADTVRHADEQAASSLLYAFATGNVSYNSVYPYFEMPVQDRIFIAQTEIIRELAEDGPAIFVGRCADHILRNHPDRLSVFIYADLDARVSRIAKIRQISRDDALELVKKTDKKRVNYYNFYTGKKWGKAENYHLLINSETLGITGTAGFLEHYVKAYCAQKTGE